MATVTPFRGTLYDAEVVGDLKGVVAPPYDVISPTEQELYHQRSPYNVIRLILGVPCPEDDATRNRYTRAAEYLGSWLRQGVLRTDPHPAFYLYRQTYSLGGERRVRRGFIGLIQLEDYGQGAVLPHEKTLPAPKADRLALLRSCRANLSPIFGLYSDPAREINSLLQEVEARPGGEDVTPVGFTHLERRGDPAFRDGDPSGAGPRPTPWGPPRLRLEDDQGVEHALWTLSQKEIVERVASAMRSRQVLIADGHHRYETALEYRREMRELLPACSGEEPFDYTMIYLANLDDEGISILPTHRLVRAIPDRGPESWPSLLEKVGEHFQVEPLPLAPGAGDGAGKVKRGGPQGPEALGRGPFGGGGTPGPTGAGAGTLLEAMAREGRGGRHAFGLYAGGDRCYLLTLKGEALPPAFLRGDIPEVWRTLDVVILHLLLLEGTLGLTPEEIKGQCLGYTQDAGQAIAAVRLQAYQLAFLVNPTRIEEVRRVATSGYRMPEKSTYFYPKLLSGLVIHKFEE